MRCEWRRKFQNPIKNDPERQLNGTYEIYHIAYLHPKPVRRFTVETSLLLKKLFKFAADGKADDHTTFFNLTDEDWKNNEYIKTPRV
jgi:hypothetical protein